MQLAKAIKEQQTEERFIEMHRRRVKRTYLLSSQDEQLKVKERYKVANLQHTVETRQ